MLLGNSCRLPKMAALAGLLCLLAGLAAAQPVRIKDIADIEGVRDNQLVGYGLVVGLNGTGDRLRTAIFTRQSLVGMLERLGVNTRDNEQRLDTRNVAAVMVTTNLPAFAQPGSRIDVAVSALGDATNLTGGTLLVTPLLGADGEVYAVAQGAVATGAIAARGAGGSVNRGVPTSARISSGAIVERGVPVALAGREQMRLSLRNPDLTTARRMAAAVIDWSHSRCTGFSQSACCMISQKISSPSRAASQALITPVTSSRPRRLTSSASRLACRGAGFISSCSGSRGRSSRHHVFGSEAVSRWPAAAAISIVADSWTSPLFVKPPRAFAMSAATDGFSAMTSVLCCGRELRAAAIMSCAPVEKWQS